MIKFGYYEQQRTPIQLNHGPRVYFACAILTWNNTLQTDPKHHPRKQVVATRTKYWRGVSNPGHENHLFGMCRQDTSIDRVCGQAIWEYDGVFLYLLAFVWIVCIHVCMKKGRLQPTVGIPDIPCRNKLSFSALLQIARTFTPCFCPLSGHLKQ